MFDFLPDLLEFLLPGLDIPSTDLPELEIPSLGDIFFVMTTGLLKLVIESILSSFTTVSTDIIQSAFFIEDTPGLNVETLSPFIVDNALDALYIAMVGLLTLKLCWKGYKIYILWRDGESEVSPFNMLVNSVFAIAVAVSFPYLYRLAVNIVVSISSSIMNVFPSIAINDSTANVFSYAWDTLCGLEDGELYGQAWLSILIVLIYTIVLVILIFQTLFRGVQMLIYRLGIPLAVVGLIDSDGGVWRSYIQIFFQQLAVVMVQNFCIRLSISLIASVSIVSFTFGLVFLLMAFKTPKILAPMLPASNSGGHSLYAIAMTAKMFTGGK